MDLQKPTQILLPPHLRGGKQIEGKSGQIEGVTLLPNERVGNMVSSPDTNQVSTMETSSPPLFDKLGMSISSRIPVSEIEPRSGVVPSSEKTPESKIKHFFELGAMASGIESTDELSRKTKSLSSWSVSDHKTASDSSSHPSNSDEAKMSLARQCGTVEECDIRRFQNMHLYDGKSVGVWCLAVEPVPKPTFLMENIPFHWERAVDTTSGELLAPVEQPQTMMNLDGNAPIDQCRWHQLHWTTNSLVTRENTVRREKAWKRQAVSKIMAAVTNGTLPGMKTYQLEEPPEKESQEPWIIRPAKAEDMPAITELYNMEVRGGYQAVDTEELSARDFLRVLQACEESNLHFLVAVTQPISLEDPKKWPDFRLYRWYMKQKEHLSLSMPDAISQPAILGFGFLGENNAGVIGSSATIGRYTGQIRIYVHPDHRLQGIGRALLEKLLIPTEKKFRSIIIEAFFQSQHDTELSWMERFLSRYEFTRVCYLEDFGRTKRGKHSAWLDKVTWRRQILTKEEVGLEPRKEGEVWSEDELSSI
jgi:L-amino acid N-acyltransferase YncA